MKLCRAVLVLSSFIVLAGCSSHPLSFGERLSLNGSAIAAVGKKWDAGNASATKGAQMVAKGNKLLEKAKKEQEQGQKLVIDGQALIVSGKQQMSAAEADYHQLSNTPVVLPAAQK